jgi:DNA-binding transcriptional ArsR family regulator
MTRYRTRETYARLAERIEKSLTSNGVSVRDLSASLGVGQSVVRRRLIELEEVGRAHHVSMCELGRLGAAHVWVLGPAPGNTQGERQRILAERRERVASRVRMSISAPHQVTNSTYPSNACRDPLVAALFGAGPGRKPS